MLLLRILRTLLKIKHGNSKKIQIFRNYCKHDAILSSMIMGSLGNQLPSAKSQCYQKISLTVPRFPQITCGLLKKTLRESANLAGLSYKVVVSQTLPVSGLLPGGKLETTKSPLNSRNLEVKIEGTMEIIPCNIVSPCSFLMSCFQRIDS